MPNIALITGGARSGKSRYALEYAGRLGRPRAFIATCPRLDDEMRERIRRHQAERRRGEWATVEAPLDLAGAIAGAADSRVRLVDCLTLWVGNVMHEAECEGRTVEEDVFARKAKAVAEACAAVSGATVFVTNEVGLGIVPADPSTRLYRDCVGRVNQTIAEAADRVVLVVCGQPLTVKPASGA